MNDNDKTAGATACGLLHKMKNFQFLFLIKLIQLVFKSTTILSCFCQEIKSNLQQILDLSTATILQLHELRNNFDAFFEKYKTIFFETIDLYIKEISNRFEPSNLLPLIKIFNLITDSELNDVCLEKDLFIYRDCVNFEILRTQLDIFYQIKKVKSLVNFNDIVKCFQGDDFKQNFSEILVLLKIYLTSPIANVTAERSFSGLKRIKSYLRSTMKQERLSSMTVINLESENLELIDLEEVIDEFASYKDRRMKFH